MKKTLLIGEPMALLMADTPGKLEEVSHFTRALSGAEVNIAIGLTRLGFEVEYFTKLGDDPFGHYIENKLKSDRIGTSQIKFDNEYRTGIQLKEMVEDGHDPYAPYYRKGSAAAHMTPDDIDALDLNGVELVHITGIVPALSASAREAVFRLIERVKENHIFLTFDPNLRPALWEDQETMIRVLNEIASYADVILPGTGECKTLTGTDNKEKAAQFYHELGVPVVVIKDGKKGAFLSVSQESKDCIQKEIAGFKVKKVVDTVGAGDGFCVGFLSGMLRKEPLEKCVRRGNAIGAIQVQNRSDNEGLPTENELEDFMGK